MIDDGLADDELLARSRAEPDAFGAFYCRHEDAVLRFFLRRTRRAELAADLTAETFAAALESAERFRPGPAPAEAWLFGIARNVLMSSLRRGSVEDRARNALEMPPLALTDQALDRVEELMDAAKAAPLLELVHDLPSAQRAAVKARVIDELPYGEIASSLGCSESVVRQRVSRGLRTLRLRLGERK